MMQKSTQRIHINIEKIEDKALEIIHTKLDQIVRSNQASLEKHVSSICRALWSSMIYYRFR